MKGHVGSNFDEFLAEEGLLSEAEATAVKRVTEQAVQVGDGQAHANQSVSAGPPARLVQSLGNAADDGPRCAGPGQEAPH